MSELHSDPDSELNPAQQEVLERLGATPAQRREFEPGIGEEIRFMLQSHLEEFLNELGPDVISADDPLWVSKNKLEEAHGCEGFLLARAAEEFAWTPAIAKGIVAHKAVELSITGNRRSHPLDLINEAIASLTDMGRGVGDWLQTCSEAEVNELRAQANTHLCGFLDCWPPLQTRWSPRTEVPLRAELSSGRIVISGKPDLMVGRARGLTAGVVIVDYKTGAKRSSHRPDLRFYALLETLRVGTPPRLLATSYLDSGTLQTEEVTEEVLESAALRTIDGIKILAKLRADDSNPRLIASIACRWCPAADGCEVGQRFLNDEDDDLDL